jgi:diaminopimelate decarboxylase
MLLGTQRINERGHLEVGGCDTVELAERFGTPLYVLDEDCLRENCRRYLTAFTRRAPGCLVSYSAKALVNLAVFRVVVEEGLAIDAFSAGELYTALTAEIPPDRILVHGNYKVREELEMAVEAGVHRVVVDCVEEIGRLQQVAAARGVVVDTLLRATPGVTADTHYHIQTGKIDTKFGFSIRGGAALEGARLALAAPNLRLRGIHCHIGSQIVDLEPFVEAAHHMVGFAASLRDELGVTVEDLDIGGGLGVRYLPEQQPPAVEEFAEALVGEIERECRVLGLPQPRLILEPGRSLVAEAGVTLYRVGVVKEVTGVRTFVAVDGGMSDNPRPALYSARYEAIVANKASQPRTQKVTVSGRHCETDTLIADLTAPEMAAGDLLAVQTTGAYNHSMASNYNRLARPAMVLVSGGAAELIVERESLRDLVRMDRVPARLRATSHEPATADAGDRQLGTAVSRHLL